MSCVLCHTHANSNSVLRVHQSHTRRFVSQLKVKINYPLLPNAPRPIKNIVVFATNAMEYQLSNSRQKPIKLTARILLCLSYNFITNTVIDVLFWFETQRINFVKCVIDQAIVASYFFFVSPFLLFFFYFLISFIKFECLKAGFKLLLEAKHININNVAALESHRAI